MGAIEMTTNDLYLAAVADMEARKDGYGGIATHTLPNGAVIYCSVRKVAGASIRARHFRTSFNLKKATDEYSKPISRASVAGMLAAAR